MSTRAELTRLRYNAQSAQLEVNSQYATRRGEIKANYAKRLADLESTYKASLRGLKAQMLALHNSVQDGDDNEAVSKWEELKVQRRGLALDFESNVHQLKYEYKASMASLAQTEREELSVIVQKYESERLAIYNRNIEERRSR